MAFSSLVKKELNSAMKPRTPSTLDVIVSTVSSNVFGASASADEKDTKTTRSFDILDSTVTFSFHTTSSAFTHEFCEEGNPNHLT